MLVEKPIQHRVIRNTSWRWLLYIFIRWKNKHECDVCKLIVITGAWSSG